MTAREQSEAAGQAERAAPDEAVVVCLAQARRDQFMPAIPLSSKAPNPHAAANSGTFRIDVLNEVLSYRDCSSPK
jgi:hypothetical protein